MNSFDVATEFPQTSAGIVHLNHAAVAPLPHRTAEAIRRFADLASKGLASFAPEWYPSIERARSTVAKFVGGSPDEIAFTKSTTHGLLIVAHSLRWRPGDVIVVEESTFPANWYTWKPLEELHGVRIVTWPERNFRYEIADLEAIFKQHRVRMVAASAADYATGFRHDLNAIGALARAYGALFCVDAIQVLGARPIDLEACGADFLSADGHKWMLAPEGIGLLWVRHSRQAEMTETMAGWLGRENYARYEAKDLTPHPSARRFEEGAQCVVGINALEASLALQLEVGKDEVARRIMTNRARLREGLLELGWEVISPADDAHACGILSSRHATLDPAKVAKGMVDGRFLCSARRGFLRLSPHFYNQPAHLDAALAQLKKAMDAAR